MLVRLTAQCQRAPLALRQPQDDVSAILGALRLNSDHSERQRGGDGRIGCAQIGDSALEGDLLERLAREIRETSRSP
jgi:hypothetical protein